MLNLAPFWHNSSCWELREMRRGGGGAKGKQKRDDVRETRQVKGRQVVEKKWRWRTESDRLGSERERQIGGQK